MMQQPVIEEGFLRTGGTGSRAPSGVGGSPRGAELQAGRATAEWRTWPAVPDTLTRARRSVAAFVEAAGAGADLLHRVKLAVSEAVTNVILHAYHDWEAETTPGAVHVGVALAGTGDRDELWVIVADEGCGLQPRDDSPGAGQGLRLIAAAVDQLTVIRRGEGGTELQMRFDLDSGTAQPSGRERAGRDVADAVCG